MSQIKLRQDTVKTLPYVSEGRARKQCCYWDASLPCFGVRVFPSGRRSYVCAYRVRGRKRLATLGRVDAITLDEARRKAKGYLGKVASGNAPQAEDDALYASGTVKGLAATYIDKHAKLKKRTWKEDESAIRRVLNPKLGTRLAASVTSADIERIHSEIGAKHPYAANRFLELVRKMFNLGRTWKRLPKDHVNPAVGIESFPEKKRRRYVTTAEMPRLLRAIDAEESEYARHAILLLLLTGVRVHELLRAKWSDVDWGLSTLYIGQTKNGEPVLAPLSSAAIARLKQIPQLADNSHIFCGLKPGRSLAGLSSQWGRVRACADMRDVRLHDLRRTVGSWLVQNGASLHLVGDVLNHKDPKTTAGYAYFQTEHRQRALTMHGSKILELMGPSARASDEPQEYVNESVLMLATEPTDADVSTRRSHYFSREDLYKLVWTMPVSELAERLAISDVGLAKVCRRALIPLPPRGYWAKVESGLAIPPDVLPPAPSMLLDKVRVRGGCPTLIFRASGTSQEGANRILDRRPNSASSKPQPKRAAGSMPSSIDIR